MKFTNVTKDIFDRYPGEKRTVDGEWAYQVRVDEDRPLSDAHRKLADRLLEFFNETGLAADLGVGGLRAQVALAAIAAATVTATDESLPQYARRAVTSLAREVAREAEEASVWNAGAVLTARSHTVAEMRDATPPVPPGR